MPSFLRDLWIRLQVSSWFRELPEWVREPPGLWVAMGLVAVLVSWLVFRLVRGLVRLVRGGRGDDGKSDIRREIRQLEREGDLMGVGQRWEILGKEGAALEAYRRGGLHAEAAQLLVRIGNRDAARKEAKDGEAWLVYGDLCHEDGDHHEAALAYEKAGKLFDAARSYEAAGETLAAARAYVAVGMEYNAVQLLQGGEGREVAKALEEALVASLDSTRGSSMSPDMAQAVRRAAQLWLTEGEPKRAYKLAVASEQWEVAAPIARDYLEPDPKMIDVCRRAGALLAAADIAERLGDATGAAMLRGEHHERRGEAAEAGGFFASAGAFERAAENLAAAGELRRAADLYARGEVYDLAARLYAELGDDDKRDAMLAAVESHAPESVFAPAPAPAADDDETRKVRPHAGPGAVSRLASDDDRYVRKEEIGRGGMGVVYRAHDAMLDRPVAYKVLSADVTGAVAAPAALLEEARAAARLSHPNIVQVFDAGHLPGGGFFVVMELIHGENFGQLLKKKRLSIAGAIRVGRQICSALEHAHQRRIVHRDLKPSNLMWTPEQLVKLTDFGLARAFEESVGKVMTRPAGTPYYMAPEQIKGGAVGPRTDLYSLGCVLFELLCQRTPFTGGSSLYHHLESRPEDPRSSRGEVPPGLAEVILQCLEKDPEKRPPSAAEVGRRLAALVA